MQKVDALMKPIFDQVIANELESRRLAELRDTLLPKLMSGELKVGEINV
jgi:type I restriction enzyme S subunit